MRELIEANLVQPVNPGHYIEKIPNYREAFLKYVDNPNYSVPHGIIKINPRNTTRIHIEKLGDIGSDLVYRGLAHRRDWNCYDIDSYTANQFMAYLASVLGKLPEIESEPITDSIQSLNSFSPINYQREKIHQEIDEMRTVILKDILPAPSGGINPEKLAEFKSDYQKELVRFRNKIESFLLDAVAIDDPYLRNKKIEQFRTETGDDVTDLSELMKSKGFRVITLGKFLGYSSLLMGMGSAIGTGSLLGAVGAAFGTSKVIHDAIKERRNVDFLDGDIQLMRYWCRKSLTVNRKIIKCLEKFTKHSYRTLCVLFGEISMLPNGSKETNFSKIVSTALPDAALRRVALHRTQLKYFSEQSHSPVLYSQPHISRIFYPVLFPWISSVCRSIPDYAIPAYPGY